MSIFQLINIEAKKHKRRFNLLIFLGAVLLEMFFIYSNYHRQKGFADGWMILFYNMPIINSFFLPIIMAGFASRLIDIEHKGDMLKCLYTFTSPSKIYFSKYIYGLISIVKLVLVQCICIIGIARVLDFPTDFDGKYLAFYGISTFMTCLSIYSLHMILSYFFRNQALSISTGLAGCFIGLFSSFLPRSFFQYSLPWCSYVTSLFIRLDWNESAGETHWVVTELSYASFVTSMVWIIIFTIIAILLLKKCGIEESVHVSKKQSKSKKRLVRISKKSVEFMKLKGSPSWFAFFLIPLLSALIGTLNYLGNIEILTDGWYSLWTQHTLFLCYFFMPVTIAVFSGCVWRIDHAGTNMNILLTHSTPVNIVISKFLVTIFVTTLSIGWIFILYIISGKMCGIEGRLPEGLGLWFIYGLIGAYSICALQNFLSLFIRNFIVPVIISLMGGLIGLGCLAQNIPYSTPFSLFSLGMVLPEKMNIKTFVLSSVIYTLVFIIVSVIYLNKVDVKTHE